MLFILRAALTIQVVFFVLNVIFKSRPDGITQLLLMLTGLLLLIFWPCLFSPLLRAPEKRNRRQAAVLLLAPLPLFFVAGFVGDYGQDYLFYRDLPRMKEVVALIESGSIAKKDGRIELPPQYKSLAYATHANRDANGVLTVTFFVGGGFPVKHHCYLYRSDGFLTNDIKSEWPSGFRREKQWFEVHD